MNKEPTIAIVADWMTNYGGAESVISAFHDLFPNAPIYTTLYKPSAMRELGQLQNIHTSYLQKIPFAKHQWLLSQMPAAVQMFNLDEFDIVLSSCHSVSKGVITKPSTLHISYCHTPMRYAWEEWDLESRMKKFPRVIHPLIRRQIKKLKQWDYCAAQRVDHFIANSNCVAERIKKYYQRPSEVIFPPVRTHSFKPVPHPTADYYLAVGRLIPYKKFDLIVRAFNQNGKRLTIAGCGPDLKKLKKLATQNIDILGAVDHKLLVELYANCKALIVPQLEDAGIVPLEAMASGRPVIALNKGGSLDSMKEGVTGVFLYEQTPDSLNNAITKFEMMNFDPQAIRKHALLFDTERFKERVESAVERWWLEFNPLAHA